MLYLRLKKATNKRRLYTVLEGFFAFCTVALGLLIYVFPPKDLPEEVFATVFIIVIFVFGTATALFEHDKKTENWKIKRLLHDNIVRGALKETFETMQFSPGWHLQPTEIASSGLAPYRGMPAGSDYVKGSYKGVPFVFSNLHFTTTNNDGETKSMGIFKGQWLILEVDRVFKERLILREKSEGALGEIGLKSVVETENIAFNRKFQISTDDPLNVFLILTPNLMEEIIAIDRRANARTCMSFVTSGDKNYIHITFHNNMEIFNIPANHKFTYGCIPAIRGRMKSEIQYMTGMIDALLKNDYLFKK